MANNLNQAALDFYGQPVSNSGWDPVSGGISQYLDPSTGMKVQPIYDQGRIIGYSQFDPAHIQKGDALSLYDPSGAYQSTGQFRDDGNMKSLMTFLAAAGGMYGLANMGLIPSAGIESAAGGAAGAGGIGTNVMGAGAADTGVVVGGPMSVGMPVGTPLPAMGAMAGMGAAGAAGGALGSGAAGAASSLIPGISNSTLGAGASLLGAALGSQETPGTTTENKMDPRLDQYVYGTNGTLPMTQSLLQQQYPMAQQGGQSLFNMGQGLLSRGVAANPFVKG